MKKILLLLLSTLLLAGCSYSDYMPTNSDIKQIDKNKISSESEINTEVETNKEEKEVVGLANPASVNCIEKGGKLDMKKDVDGGEYGVCILEDGQECEEWSFFKGECPKQEDNLVHKKLTELGVEIGYPNSIGYGVDSTSDVTLEVIVNKISDLPEEAPMGMGRDFVLQDKKSLSDGQYGDSFGFALPESERVFTLKNGNYAKEYAVLSMFEICDVRFQKKIVFYKDDYQVVLNLSANAPKVKEENPEYFTQNEDNCGIDNIWNFEDKSQSKFWQDLSKGNIDGLAKDWNSYFEIIKVNIIDSDVQ